MKVSKQIYVAAGVLNHGHQQLQELQRRHTVQIQYRSERPQTFLRIPVPFPLTVFFIYRE